jgi:hypothetical protein
MCVDLTGLTMTKVCSELGSGCTRLRGESGIGAVRHQQMNDSHVTVLRRRVKRSDASRGGGVGVRPKRKQDRNSSHASLLNVFTRKAHDVQGRVCVRWAMHMEKCVYV